MANDNSYDDNAPNPFDKYDDPAQPELTGVTTTRGPSMGASKSDQALDPGYREPVRLDPDLTISGAQIERHVSQVDDEEAARRDSNLGILGGAGLLDEDGAKAWAKGEREHATWSQQVWTTALDLLRIRRENIEAQKSGGEWGVRPADAPRPSGGNPFGGLSQSIQASHEQAQDFLERKAAENIENAKLREFMAREIEEGKRPGARDTTWRTLTTNAAKGVGQDVIANLMKGLGAGSKYIGAEGLGESMLDIGNIIENKVDEMFPDDDARKFEFKTSLARGAGSMVGFYGPSFAAQFLLKAGPKTMMGIASTTGGLSQSGSAYSDITEAMEKDSTITEDDRFKVWLNGLGSGATEGLPLGHWLSGPDSKWMKSMLAEAFEEGGQEFAQTVWDNVAAQRYYDKDRTWDEGAWEGAAIGGILGAKMSVVQSAWRAAREKHGVVAPVPGTGETEQDAQEAVDGQPTPGAQSPSQDGGDPSLVLDEAANDDFDGTEDDGSGARLAGMNTPVREDTDLREAPVDEDLQDFKELMGEPEGVSTSEPAPAAAPMESVGPGGTDETLREVNDALATLADDVSSVNSKAKLAALAERAGVSLPDEILGAPIEDVRQAVVAGVEDAQRALEAAVQRHKAEGIVRPVEGPSAQETRASAGDATGESGSLKDRLSALTTRQRNEAERQAKHYVSYAKIGSESDAAALVGAKLYLERMRDEDAMQNKVPKWLAPTLDVIESRIAKSPEAQAIARTAKPLEVAPGTITNEMRNSFTEVLAGDLPQGKWAKSIGASPEQMKKLEREALKDGRLRKGKGKGVLRRTPKAKAGRDAALKPVKAVAAAAAPNVGTNVTPGVSSRTLPVKHGAEHVVTTPDGVMGLRVRQEIVELADVKPQLKKSDLQPRDRTTEASKESVKKRAKDIDAARLMPRETSSGGAPIVLADGTVLSGNGRVLALQAAYGGEVVSPGLDGYQKALGPQAAGMKQPVLIQRIVEDLPRAELARFAELSNVTPDPGKDAAGKVGSPEDMAKREAKAREFMQTPEWLGATLSGGIDTSQVDGFGSDDWKASRVYVAADGTDINGYDAAIAYLTAQIEAKVPGGPLVERKAYIVIGLPGAGKSTIANPLAAGVRAVQLSADDAKPLIPEYEGGWNSVGAHEEASMMLKDVKAGFEARGVNLLLDKIGSSVNSIAKPAASLRANGYDVTLMHVDVPKAIAMERAIKRFRETGRSLPVNTYDELRVGEVFATLKSEGAADETAIVEWKEPGGWQLSQGAATLGNFSLDPAFGSPGSDVALRDAGVDGGSGQSEPGSGQSAGGEALVIPPAVRIDRLVREIEEKTSRTISPVVIDYATRLEEARGDSVSFAPVFAEILGDATLNRADALELARLAGIPPTSRTSKAAALESLKARHLDQVQYLETINAANAGSLEQGQGDLPEGSSAEGVQGLEGLGLPAGASEGSGGGSGGDVAGRGGADAQLSGAAGGLSVPGEGAGNDTGNGAGDRQRASDPRPARVEISEETRAQIAEDAVAAFEAREERTRRNYQITDADEIGKGGAKVKVKANLAAIETLKRIEDENREATPDEKAILVKYAGWGAFAQDVFSDHKAEWAKERKALQSLMTPEEYKSARASTLNAHYTSPDVIRGMWTALEHLGFKGGRALEPSAGVGHFIGMTPAGLREWTNWTAVDLDSLSARITKALYSAADVREAGFETQVWPDGFFDLAISNVPFDKTGPYDPRYKTKFSLHDYFFVKSLDKVRPGGIVAFVTSSFTLDKQSPTARREIAKRATFLGAVRLPGGSKGAFKANAGTDVTTDIIFLRKRVAGEPLGDQTWLERREIKTPEGPAEINAYFADNPDMMLGKMRLIGTQYGPGEPVLIGSSENLDQAIADAVKANIAEGAMLPLGTTSLALADEVDTEADSSIKEGAFYDKDGKIFRKVQGVGQVQKMAAAEADKARSFMAIRGIVSDMLAQQAKGDKSNMEGLRVRLNAAYDAFVEKFGPINKVLISQITRKKDGRVITQRRYPNFSQFSDDPDAYKVSAIELYDEKTGDAKKSAIFTEDVVGAYTAPEIFGPSDALAVSLNETGRVDMELIADRLGVSQAEAAAVLGDEVYQDPNGAAWRTRAQYLSGDVVTKLEAARAAVTSDSRYQRNVEALEKVQPEPLTRLEITVPMGASWVPAEVYNDFLREALDARGFGVALNEQTKVWRLMTEPGYMPPAVQTQWGTNRVAVSTIIEAALNSTPITVSDKQVDGSSVRNQEAEAEARAKVDLLRERFTGQIFPGAQAAVGGWVWEDEQQAERLEQLYNRAFNRIVKEQYDGSHLTFPGLARVVSFPDGSSGTINLTPARVNTVWRIVQSGNTLIDHVVGAGKTWTAIMSGMEQKRLGLVQRPMYVVPNHMLEQFSREFYQAYPDAKLLIATKDNMSSAKRREFAAKVASDKWDGIIITHSAFGRVRMSDEAYKTFYQEQIDTLAEAMDKAAKEDGKKAPTVKDIERAKKRIQTKLDKLIKAERKDAGVTFEEMGVDFLYVDEAHEFKNLWFMTRHTRVKGISSASESQKATDLYIKMRHLEKSRPGRSGVFMTGTPVSNTMAEVYTMMRYLQHDTLNEYGIGEFDSWAQTFGTIETKSALGSNSRDIVDTTSFSRFVNIPELSTLYGQIADTKTAADLNLPRPDLVGGKPSIVTSELSEREEAFLTRLIKDMDQIKGKKPQPGDPNFLSLFTQGLQVGTDLRLIDPSAPFNETGKIANAINNAYDIWVEGNEDPKSPKKAQLIFLDMGVPGSKGKGKVASTETNEEIESDIERIRRKLGEDEDAEGQTDAADDEADADNVEAEAMLEGKFNLYADIRERLIDKGVPAHEIAFIHDAKNDEQKAKLFEAVRSGAVRILLGSSKKMGVGTNVQKLLYALHHVDAPWRPSDVEQRDGRIVRQGNKNPEVKVIRYVTKKSFDAYRWQVLETKANFIAQFRAGARGVRIAEDIDSPLPDAAELKAVATGDPRIMEQAVLGREVRVLEAQRAAHTSSITRAQRALDEYRRNVTKFSSASALYDADAARVTDISGDNFAITMLMARGEMRPFDDRKKAGDVMRSQILALAERSWYGRKVELELGTLSGFDLSVHVARTQDGVEATFEIKGATNYTSQTFMVNDESNPLALVRRAERLLGDIPAKAAYIKARIAETEAQLPKLEKGATPTPFGKEDQLNEQRARLAALNEALKPKKPEAPKPATPEAVADEDGQFGLDLSNPNIRASLAMESGATPIEDIGPNDPHPSGPVLAYHGTDVHFETFSPEFSRDLGVHFGGAEQANKRAEDIFARRLWDEDLDADQDSDDYQSPADLMDATPDEHRFEDYRILPAVLDIRNPFTVPVDVGTWDLDIIPSWLVGSAVPEDQIIALQDNVSDLMRDGDVAEAREAIQKVLEAAGYDALRYQNQFEGPGWSYIVWKKNQVRSATGGMTLMSMAREAPVNDGFTSTVYYHGTSRDVTSFDINAAKRSGGDENAIFVTPSREEARSYGENVHEVHVRPGRQKVVTAADVPNLVVPATRRLPIEQQSIYYNKVAFNQAVEAARAEGFDTVRFANVMDASSDEDGGNRSADQIAILNTANIRDAADVRAKLAAEPAAELTLTAKAQALLPEALSQLASEIRRMLPGSVAVRVSDRLLAGGTMRGGYDVGKRLLVVSASDGVDLARAAGKHEVVHVLRELGLFTKAEWDSLVDRARRLKVGRDIRIEAADGSGDYWALPRYRQFYRNNLETLGFKGQALERELKELIDQELVAKMAESASEGARYGAALDALIDRIYRVLEAVGNVLRRLGLNQVSDIVEDRAAQQAIDAMLTGATAERTEAPREPAKTEEAAEVDAVMASPEWQRSATLEPTPEQDTSQQPGYGSVEWQRARRYKNGATPVVGFTRAVRVFADRMAAMVPGGVANERRAVVIMGYPGSGKSTIANAVRDTWRGVHLSADDAKPMIPEYEGGANSGGVHAESVHLAVSATKTFIDRGDNVILETIGETPESVAERAKILRAAGYRVSLIGLDIDKETAKARAVERFKATGRAVPAELYDTLSPGDTYERAKGAFDETLKLGWDGAGWTAAEQTPGVTVLARAIERGPTRATAGGRSGAQGVEGNYSALSLTHPALAREAAVRDLGFDTDTIWLHGSTNPDLARFSHDKKGTSTPAKNTALGFFFTNDRSYASIYTRFGGKVGKVHELYLRLTNPLKLTAPDGYPPDPTAVLDAAAARALGKDEASLTRADFEAWRDQLKAQGHDGILVSNPSYKVGDGPMLNAIMFEPDDIRATDVNLRPSFAADPDRLARARDMGFDTSTVMYHGTDRKFNAFQARAHSGGSRGVYLTPDRGAAERFAKAVSDDSGKTPHVVEAFIRSGDFADLNNETHLAAIAQKKFEAIKADKGLRSQRDYSLADAMADVKRHIVNGRLGWHDRHTVQAVQDAGFSGVLLNDAYDTPSVLVFDPVNIRATDADFDPDFSDSADLRASLINDAPLPGEVEDGLSRLAGKLEGRAPGVRQTRTAPGPVKSLAEMIGDIKTSLGMTATQGRYGLSVTDKSSGPDSNRPPKTWRFRPQASLRAQYDGTTGVARYRLSSDIEAIAHEGGHHLERIFGPALRRLERELGSRDELRSYASRNLTDPADDNAMPVLAPAYDPTTGRDPGKAIYSGMDLDSDTQRLLIETATAEDQAAARAQARSGMGRSQGANTDAAEAELSKFAVAGRAELEHRLGQTITEGLIADIRQNSDAVSRPMYVQRRFSATGTPKAAPQRPDDLSEGFAEFFREYILNPEAAKRFAPLFFERFEDFLDANGPNILQNLERAQLVATSKEYEAYLSATTLDRARADLVSEADQRISAKTRETLKAIGQGNTISGFASRVYSAAIDEAHPFYLATAQMLNTMDERELQRANATGATYTPPSLAVHENPYKLLRSISDSFKTGLMWIQNGIPNYRQAMGPRSPALHDALMMVMGKNWRFEAYQDFGVYLESKRAIEEWKLWDEKRNKLVSLVNRIKTAGEQMTALREALSKERGKAERRQAASQGGAALIREYDNVLQRLTTSEANIVRELQEGQVATPGLSAAQVRNARSRLAQTRKQIAAYEDRRATLVARAQEVATEQAQVEARIEALTAGIAKREAIIANSRTERDQLRAGGLQRAPHRIGRAEHEERIRELERNYPKLRQASQAVYDFLWQSAVHDHQAGRLTDAELAYRETRRHFYVPFARDMSDMVEPRGIGGRSPKGKRFGKDKTFEGSDRAIVNPIETIIDQTFHRAAATHFNDVMKTLAALSDRVGPGGGEIVERVVKEETVDATRKAFETLVGNLTHLGYSEDDAREMVKRVEADFGDTQLLLTWSPEHMGAKRPLLLPLWENGERKYLRVNDPEFASHVYNSVQGMGREMSNLFMDIAAKPATWLRASITTNPTFVVPNIFRDMWAAWMLTGSVMDPRTWPLITQARGLYHEFGQTNLARLYQEVAGPMGGQNVAALSRVRDKADVMALKDHGLHMKPLRLLTASALGAAAGFGMAGPPGTLFGAIIGAGLHRVDVKQKRLRFLETISSFSDLSETATRLGVFSQAYKAALAYNPSLTPYQAAQEAAYVARDLIDFGRRGSRMMAAARLVPFLNANVQGLDKFARTALARSDRGQQIGVTKLAGAAGVGMIVGAPAGPIGMTAGAFAGPLVATMMAERVEAVRRLLLPWSKQNLGMPLSEDDRKTLATSTKLWTNLLIYTLLGLAFRWLYDDDDEYKMIDAKVKFRAQPVKIGGEWYQLPKAFEFAIPGTILEAAIDTELDNDPRLRERILDGLFETLMPPGVPQSVKLWSDIRGNYNSRTGRQIVPEWDLDLPPQEQFNAYSSELAIAMSRAVNESPTAKAVVESVGGAIFNKPNFELSPAVIDYAISSGAGYWGKDVQKLSNIEREAGARSGRIQDVPIIGTMLERLSIDPYRQNDALKAHYELMRPSAQGLVRTAAGYDQILKTRGQEAANQFLATVDEDHRAYALVQAQSDVNERRLHPLNRLDTVVSAIRSVEQDVVSERLENTEDKGEPKELKLGPTKAREVLDLLAKIKATEAGNTLTGLGIDQFAARRPIDLKPMYDVLKASSPAVAEELERRFERKHVAEFDEAMKEWLGEDGQPGIKAELLKEWNESVANGNAALPSPKKRRVK
jgi:N12 class adenine-specific DNA methylase/adenylate kinase family enzyme